ncbi:hypothetical protein [Pseudomonas sp. 2(2015)]|uniref:hypothetical protein n=1 Tax=Pseudomonas sp. 2(2015) TaxID=1619950 RepID=UPI0005EBE21E|nr:hypothetical protein [Pseudomonas sp. 2(2015)]KJK14910.1 hypothetical protein UB48_24315 [Pseudomonas sp. 2(2015)]
MESFTPNVWFPVVTLVAGAILKAVFDLFNEKRQEAREKRVRLEKRQETFLMQRIEAQRLLLPQLQESLVELMRSTTLLNMEDVQSFRNTGVWGKELVSDEISERSMAAFRQVNLFRVRVHADDLREDVTKLCALCSEAVHTKSEYTSELKLREAGMLFTEVNERVGEVYRSLDAQERAILS